MKYEIQQLNFSDHCYTLVTAILGPSMGTPTQVQSESCLSRSSLLHVPWVAVAQDPS